MSHQDIKDTVLHAAVKKKDVDIAKILVECGCPVDIQNVNANCYLVFFLNVPKKYPQFFWVSLFILS